MLESQQRKSKHEQQPHGMPACAIFPCQAATGACSSRALAAEAGDPRWTYYKAHKSELIQDISLYRDAILERLICGASPDEAFAPYRREAASVMSMSAARATCRNAQARQTALAPQARAERAAGRASKWIDGIFNPRRQAVLARAGGAQPKAGVTFRTGCTNRAGVVLSPAVHVRPQPAFPGLTALRYRPAMRWGTVWAHA